MLKIFNNMRNFIEDCYRQYSVREYSRLMHISPPSASKILKELYSEKLLNKTEYRNNLLFWANKENATFKELSRLYWRQKLEYAGLLKFLEKKFINPTIILFGSLAKAETTRDSDIDIAIIIDKKEFDVSQFEKKIKRKIQIIWFDSLQDIKNKELLNNIINGTVLLGRLKL